MPQQMNLRELMQRRRTPEEIRRKHELAALRASIITRLYEQSKPMIDEINVIEAELFDSDGKHIASLTRDEITNP